MKITATAPANIAFIKYWGKKDALLRTPANASVSMNVSGAFTTTTVEFSKQYSEDSVRLLGGDFSPSEIRKVTGHLDRIRDLAHLKTRARVATKNSFPRGAGAASSASGFAALTVAGCAAAGLRIPEKDMTILARLGSGSACRSIPGGFVKWIAGDTSDESYAYSLYPASHWNVLDILVVVDAGQKAVSTTAGMERAATSPYWRKRLEGIDERIARTEGAIRTRDLRALGEVAEEDCLSMHAVMMSQAPPVLYWNGVTQKLIKAVKEWRDRGLGVYFTIDAGPNVHLLCEEKDKQAVLEALDTVSGIQDIIVNRPAAGAHIISQHLF